MNVDSKTINVDNQCFKLLLNYNKHNVNNFYQHYQHT